jgi:hypothetical protein
MRQFSAVVFPRGRTGKPVAGGQRLSIVAEPLLFATRKTQTKANIRNT